MIENGYLVAVVIILTVVILAGCIYLLVYFQHPEDKNVAWFPKIVTVFGFLLAAWSVLMLPLDVANKKGSTFPMDQLWLAVYIMIAVMVVIVIPFAIFYYESEEAEPGAEGSSSQLASGIKGTVLTLVVFMVITVILWFTIGIAEIPVVVFLGQTVTLSPPQQAESFNSTGYYYPFNGTETAATLPYYSFNVTNTYNISNTTTDDQNVTVTTYDIISNYTTYYYYNYSDSFGTVLAPKRVQGEHLKYRVTFLLYIISMVVFFGWVMFIVFGGIGLVAFPFDAINDFKKRPIRIPLDQYTKRKAEIGERATKLIEIGTALKEKQRQGGSRRQRRRQRTNYNKFRQAVFFLEEDYERLQICYKRQGGKVLLYYAQLLFGIIGAGLTILWLLQILLFVFTQPYPFDPFLNNALKRLDQAWGFLGAIFYGLFAFYLLICCIKGNFKFGMRIFILFPIHPMRVGGTLMNAFLFNTLIILVCAVSITQFTTTAFSDYTSLTSINSLFSVSVRNLMGIKYVFLAYIYILFIFVFLTGIYLAIKPKEKPATDQIVI